MACVGRVLSAVVLFYGTHTTSFIQIISYFFIPLALCFFGNHEVLSY